MQGKACENSLCPLIWHESVKFFWELKQARVLLPTHPLSSWVYPTWAGLAGLSVPPVGPALLEKTQAGSLPDCPP